MTTRDEDPYTGEIFESKDKRDPGRRLRVLEVHPNQNKVGFVNDPDDLIDNLADTTVYRAIRVDLYGNQVWAQGQRRLIRITAATLDKRYRKVSR